MSVDISLKLTYDATDTTFINIQVKILSAWLPSITTEAFVDGTTSWKSEVSETSIKKGIWSRNIQPTFSNVHIQSFNKSPGIYFVITGVSNDVNHLISFAYCDCSSFMIETGDVGCRSPFKNGIQLSASVSCSEFLFPLENTLHLEPIMLRIESINAYPVEDNASLEDSLNNVYLFGNFDFGESTRFVYGAPTVSENEDLTVTSSLSYKTCILCAQESRVLNFKERLTSSTFELELHSDDVSRRALDDALNAAFHLLKSDSSNTDAATSSTPASAAASKVKKPDPKGATLSGLPAKLQESSGPLSALDLDVVAAIERALQSSSKIFSHGKARFRLEQLLDNAADMLLEFGKTRSGKDNSDVTVVVKEEFILEVLTAKPSSPPRWYMPSDISMKSALEKTKAKRSSSLDASNRLSTSTQAIEAGDTLPAGPGPASSILKQTLRHVSAPRPFYERFKDFSTSLALAAELHRKYTHKENLPSVTQPVPEQETALQRRLRITPYARMVIMMKYDDDKMLHMINDAIAVVNGKALPNIQGTLRSYSFTPQEVQDANDGVLDIVCGFSIIDDEFRLIVIEGLGGIGQAMQSIFADIPREKENDKDLKILCNPEVLFPSRKYTDFGPDLKRVRPREKLKRLAKRPALYNRKQVDLDCFEAVDAVLALRRAFDMKTTKDLDMYPSASSINKLELLYGDALSKVDLDGDGGKTLPAKHSDDAHSTSISSSTLASSASLKNSEAGRHAKSGHRTSRLMVTDCRNPEFDNILAYRESDSAKRNFLQEQRELRKLAWAQALERMARREEDDQALITKVLGPEYVKNGGKIYCYAGQKNNFKEALLADQRKILNAAKGSSFTYSQDFLSQSIALVDEDRDKAKNKEDEKGQWTTPKGFVYPPPKTRKELIAHPKKPSDARILDLQEPFESFENAVIPDPILREKEENFKVGSTTGGELFGILEAPAFSHDFELSKIGDRDRLPRGNLIAGESKNEAFWRSVHLSGEEARKRVEDAIAAEKEEWNKKVVVDHLDFKVGGFKVNDRPSQLSRTEDILKDPPQEKSLIALRAKKSSTGKDLSYTTTPLSIMNDNDYVANQQEKSLLRTEDKSKFITTKVGDQGGQDFTRYIHESVGKPKIQAVIHKMKHPGLDETEKVGPKWQSSLTHDNDLS